jgi:hypothetical protein
LEVFEMRKVFFLTVILLVVTAFAVAQQPSRVPPGPGNRPSAPSMDNGQVAQPSPAGNSVEGCLGRTAGNFTVTDRTGTTYQLQLPQNADTSKLSQHIGEEVRVTGTMSGGSDTSNAFSMKNTINVKKMNTIGSTCSNKSATPSK